MNELQLQLSETPQMKLAVISHERSGSNFLKNAIAMNFNYSINPLWNFDITGSMGMWSTEYLRDYYFKQVAGKSIKNILKSHHQFQFFSEFIEEFLNEFIVLYIYRDPRDVMISYWHYILNIKWHEGPKTKSIGDFLRAEPCGAMMRYQWRQSRHILDRWRQHVSDWYDYKEKSNNKHLYLIKYEELDQNYHESIKRLSKCFDMPLTDEVKRPNRRDNVIMPNEKITSNERRKVLLKSDHHFILDCVGDTMKALGYVE